MALPAFNKSEASFGAAIVGAALMIFVFAAMIFATNNSRPALSSLFAEAKYPATAFVVKRQGRLKSKTTYVGIAAGNGMSVDMSFDKAKQKLKLKILDRKGRPLSRVSVEARASKVGQRQNPKRIVMQEIKAGEYRSDEIGLERGGWILTVSAYDLYNRSDAKLLFHTEKPVFFK